MSQSQPGAPQSLGVLVYAVTELRNTDAVVDLLYADSEVPSQPADRRRVYDGSPDRANAHPIEVAVEVIPGSSERRKDTISRSYLVRCTIVCTDEWFDRNGALRMVQLSDAIENVAEAGGYQILPAGRAEGSSVEAMNDGTGRRELLSGFRFTAHD